MKSVIAVFAISILASFAGARDINGGDSLFDGAGNPTKAAVDETRTSGHYAPKAAPAAEAAAPAASAESVPLPPITTKQIENIHITEKGSTWNAMGYVPWNFHEVISYKTAEQAEIVMSAWIAKFEAAGIKVSNAKTISMGKGYAFEFNGAGPNKVESFVCDAPSSKFSAAAKHILDGMKSYGITPIASGRPGYTYGGKSMAALWFSYVSRPGKPEVLSYHVRNDDNAEKAASLLAKSGAAVLCVSRIYSTEIFYISKYEIASEITREFSTRAGAAAALLALKAAAQMDGVILLEALVEQQNDAWVAEITYTKQQ